MKLLKLFVLMAAAVAGSQALAAGDAEAGKEKAAPCAACHGQKGNEPMMATYPKLAGQGEKYLVKQLEDFKSGARDNAIMKQQAAKLSEQDMQDIAAYYASQEAQVSQANPDLAAQGEKLYRGGDMQNGIPACSGCHGPAGQGIDAAVYPALGGQNADYVISQLEAFRAAGRNDLGDGVVKRTNDPKAMMRIVAAELSDTQIKQLASFISGLSE